MCEAINQLLAGENVVFHCSAWQL